MNILKYIIEIILKLKKDIPILIAFDGVDTSGKTSLADNIYKEMKSKSILLPIRISIDKFHNPKNIRIRKGELSPEGFYFDSFNYESIINNIIKPIKSFSDYIIPETFDYKVEQKIPLKRVPLTNNTVILFDGIFMNRDELYKYWDLSIFLDISFETVIQRAVLRDVSLFGSKEIVLNKYQKRYIPGEKLYLKSCCPKDRADIVIDNNDYNKPIIIKEWGNYI